MDTTSTSATATHPADRLLEAIDRRAAPVCVGIDPVITRLPERHQPRSESPGAQVRSLLDFSMHTLDAVAEHVPCVKFQSACFERYRHYGVQVLYELIAEARHRGLAVILDGKRGDIGISAEHYAAAAFDPPRGHEHEHADWLTVNGYLGIDAIEPFLKDDHGSFVLVRTSNPGSDGLQAMKLENGTTVAQHLARLIHKAGEKRLGSRGYSAIGAVVGATKPEDAAKLRTIMPKQLFLVPGYGAQGGTVDDVLACFQRDTRGGMSGAIITASRSVIYTYEATDSEWRQRIADAAAAFAEEIGKAIGAR